MTVQGESLDMWADSYVFPILLVPRPQSSSLVLLGDQLAKIN